MERERKRKIKLEMANERNSKLLGSILLTSKMLKMEGTESEKEQQELQHCGGEEGV